MKPCNSLLSIAAAAGLALTLAAPRAEARGALGYDQEACVLKVGPDFLYFSGYQFAVSQRKFCEDVPEVGETTLVFDLAQDELRQMKLDFRIMRDSGAKTTEDAAADASTVAYLPPETYPKGTFSFVHKFDEPGNFVGVVTADGPNGEHWVASYPFSVGGAPASMTPLILLALACALTAGLYFASRPREKKAKKA
ncbi:MAG TPA: hypothetical protein VIF61_06185 [Methylocystis sp.]|jgi:hypothetical protein